MRSIPPIPNVLLHQLRSKLFLNSRHLIFIFSDLLLIEVKDKFCGQFSLRIEVEIKVKKPAWNLDRTAVAMIHQLGQTFELLTV